MPSAQGSPKRGEKEATPAAVADLCFCQGNKCIIMTDFRIPGHSHLLCPCAGVILGHFTGAAAICSLF